MRYSSVDRVIFVDNFRRGYSFLISSSILNWPLGMIQAGHSFSCFFLVLLAGLGLGCLGWVPLVASCPSCCGFAVPVVLPGGFWECLDGELRLLVGESLLLLCWFWSGEVLRALLFRREVTRVKPIVSISEVADALGCLGPSSSSLSLRLSLFVVGRVGSVPQAARVACLCKRPWTVGSRRFWLCCLGYLFAFFLFLLRLFFFSGGWFEGLCCSSSSTSSARSSVASWDARLALALFCWWIREARNS
jgi:hypothetical protein